MFLLYISLLLFVFDCLQLDHTEPFGPRGLCPWVSWEGKVLTDSQLIMNQLAAANEDWNLNRNLSEKEKAVARAFAVMADEHLCW